MANIIADDYYLSIALSDVAALQAVPSANLQNNVMASAGKKQYFWDGSSTLDPNGISVISPSDITPPAPGRWIISNFQSKTYYIADSPSSTSDYAHGFNRGDFWINSGNTDLYFCVDNTDNNAAWPLVDTTSFADLTDVTAPYDNIGAIYAVNGAKNGIIELTTLITEPAAHQVMMSRGTTDLLVTASSTIDQDLATTSKVTHAGAILTDDLELGDNAIQSGDGTDKNYTFMLFNNTDVDPVEFEARLDSVAGLASTRGLRLYFTDEVTAGVWHVESDNETITLNTTNSDTGAVSNVMGYVQNGDFSEGVDQTWHTIFDRAIDDDYRLYSQSNGIKVMRLSVDYDTGVISAETPNYAAAVTLDKHLPNVKWVVDYVATGSYFNRIGAVISPKVLTDKFALGSQACNYDMQIHKSTSNPVLLQITNDVTGGSVLQGLALGVTDTGRGLVRSLNRLDFTVNNQITQTVLTNGKFTSNYPINVISGQSYQINNVDVNLAGTWSNICYKNQDNLFSVEQTASIAASVSMLWKSINSMNSWGAGVESNGNYYIKNISATTYPVNIGSTAKNNALELTSETVATITRNLINMEETRLRIRRNYAGGVAILDLEGGIGGGTKIRFSSQTIYDGEVDASSNFITFWRQGDALDADAIVRLDTNTRQVTKLKDIVTATYATTDRNVPGAYFGLNAGLYSHFRTTITSGTCTIYDAANGVLGKIITIYQSGTGGTTIIKHNDITYGGQRFLLNAIADLTVTEGGTSFVFGGTYWHQI